MFVSAYLPDSQKSWDLYEGAVRALDALLEEIWCNSAWTSICLGGDLNCELVPVDGVLGENCSGIRGCDRCGLLMDLSKKWMLGWDTSFMDKNQYTHMHYSHKVTSTLGYMLNGGVCALAPVCAKLSMTWM
jgi:hypothetical protein